MFWFSIFFLIGDCLLQQFPVLPNARWVVALNITFIIFYIIKRKELNYLNLLLAFLLGFTITYWHASRVLSYELPPSQELKPTLITGTIASLPISERWATTFHIELPNHSLIRLSWKKPTQPITIGDNWQFRVKLKRIHGLQNPGSMDYEAYALQKHLRAQGAIINSPDNHYLGHHQHFHLIDQYRQQILNKLQPLLPNTQTANWLVALMLGERQHITADDWQVLRNTGTNHLMAIAGLHIGILAALTALITSWCWRRSRTLMLMLPSQLAGAIAALIAAILYSALAGFSIPTQRACFMLIFVMLSLFQRQQTNPWHIWSSALLAVLILNPLSLLNDSFWLSFGTIALIIYGMRGRLGVNHFWWKHGRVQWVIAMGLIPFSLLFFQETSIISLAANSIAIPWLGFLILPFCLSSILFLFLSPTIATWLLTIADKSLSLLWQLLTWFSHLSFASWHHAMPSMTIFIMTLIAFILLLSPAGTPGKWLGSIWLLPLFLYRTPTPKQGDFEMTLLDVGQGLSAIVQTQSHTLIFDTGLDERAVLPYLESQGIHQVDTVVISHGDKDHIGGLEALQANIKIKTITTSVPKKIHFPNTTYCLAGQQWQWDNVKFSFLYPKPENLMSNNDSSCVLKIENNDHQLLLTGDIEKAAEKNILNTNSHHLPSSILVAPHHGSKTSAWLPFVSAIHPAVVLYATGYRNRYHFPHPSVTQTYTNLKTKQLNTADAGAINIQFKRGESATIKCYRDQRKRYWHETSQR